MRWVELAELLSAKSFPIASNCKATSDDPQAIGFARLADPTFEFRRTYHAQSPARSNNTNTMAPGGPKGRGGKGKAEKERPKANKAEHKTLKRKRELENLEALQKRIDELVSPSEPQFLPL